MSTTHTPPTHLVSPPNAETPNTKTPEGMAPRLDITVVTLFPEMFPGPLTEGLLGQALTREVWSLRTVNIRDFAHNAYGSVDDEAFGGGPGMVLRPDVVGRACEAAIAGVANPVLISLTPRGVPLTQEKLVRLANDRRPLVLLCGRYEGIDQRVVDHYGFEEISIGDFVLMGGEVPAMVLIEGCVRLLEGVVGNRDSLSSESFADDLLEYPHYTRPRVWREVEVPPVLCSGNHKAIETWRRDAAETLTQTRRPDMWTRKKSRVRVEE